MDPWEDATRAAGQLFLGVQGSGGTPMPDPAAAKRLEVRKRLFDQVREGEGPKDMLERGVLKGLARTWNDPDRFLYDAAKGLWAHHDKLGPNVV